MNVFSPSVREWVFSQTNRALHSASDVDYAVKALTEAGLPLHPDRNKNWDNLLALYHTTTSTAPNEPVLDAGAGDESAYLPGLRRLGYTNLVGINLDRVDDYHAGERDGIQYAYGDITGTSFPDATFKTVACLSVIEHGVNWHSFIVEMARIIKPGGDLFLSFDYWIRPIDTTGLTTHGAPINIFSAAKVDRLLDLAHKKGLQLVTGQWDSDCSAPLLHWAGIDYTFCNLLFRRDP